MSTTRRRFPFYISLAGLFLITIEIFKDSPQLTFGGVIVNFLLHNVITTLFLVFIFPILTTYILFTRQEAAET